MSFLPNQFALSDGPQLSAFSQLNVTTTHSVFDCQLEYGLDTQTAWDATANGTLASASSDGSVSSGGNSVGPVNTNTRLCPITVSSTNTHYSVLQSRQYCRYIPGKGNISYITGVFAAGADYTAHINLRTSTSGSAVDTSVAQSSWSEDKFDGTGKSGVTIDFTKVQILVIDAQMLYAGRVRVGFDIDGKVYWAHYFKVANNQSLPTMQTYNLPVRVEGRTGASSTTFRMGRFDSANGVFLSTTRTTTGGTINFLCCSVQNNGDDELRGFPRAAPASTAAIGVTTRRPVLSIRPKATYNSRTNRGHIESLEFLIRATTNDSMCEIVIGGTLTGAAFTSVGAASIAEYDISATAITGGTTIKQFNAISGSGSSAVSSGTDTDFRNPLTLSQIDALTATQTTVTLVCTSYSGTSNVASGANWHERVI